MAEKHPTLMYVPAIHSGVLEFIEKNSSSVGVLDDDLVAEQPRMERDIRRLPPKMAASMLQIAMPNIPVDVVSRQKLQMHLDGYETIVMPDEDISHTLKSTGMLDSVAVDIRPAFLRWDRNFSTANQTVESAVEISADVFLESVFYAARAEASRSVDWWRQVGAVILIDGTVVLEGHNTPSFNADYTFGTFGDPRSNFDAGEHIEISRAVHAEAGLIAAAAKQGISLENAQIAVTTFPCPNCAKLIATSGITAVYYQDGYSLLDAEETFKAHDIALYRVVSN